MTLTKSTEQLAPYGRRWLGLGVLSASLLLVVMDMTILNVALPSLSRDLRPDSVQLLWIVDAYSLVLAGLLVTASALGDRFGRKRMLLLGFTVFGLASVAVLWADTPNQVIAVRALLAIGGAMIMPSTLSLIRNMFTDARERATAIGIWAVMASVGGVLGPILGGVLLEHFSWHSAFLVNVPVMVVAVLAGLFLLPESKNPNPGRWDAFGTVQSIVGMVALVYGIKQFGKEGFTDPAALLATALAVATLTWFVLRCARRPDPLLQVRLFRGRAFTAGTITAFTTMVAMAAMMLLLAQWMQLVHGYSPLEAGFRLLPMALAAGVISPLAAKIAGAIGARTVLAGGLALGAVGFGVLFAASGNLDYGWVALSLTLIGAGLGSLAIASVVIMAGAPPEQAGSAAAIEETSYELGGAFGVAVLGSLAAASYRDELGSLDASGLSGEQVAVVRDSLGGALEVAQRAGATGGEIAAQARSAFEASLGWFGLAGAVIMLVGAVAVYVLTPRELDLDRAEH